MQKENKNEEEKSSSEERTLDKVDYTIQTMDSDLKRKSPKENSIGLSDLEKEKELKDKEKKKEKVPEKKAEKKPQPKKNFNPFLDDLQPIEKFESESQEPESEKKAESVKKPDFSTPSSPENKKGLEEKASVIQKSFDVNSQPPVVKKELKKKKSGVFLLIFLFTLSLITVGAGFYYYFHLNPSKPKELIQKEPAQEEPLIEEPVVEEVFSEKLQTSQSLTIEEGSSLTALFKNQKENLPSSTSNYYQIKQASENLTSLEVLSLLDIKLPEEVLNNLGEAWVMAYNQEEKLKMNLVLEVTQNSQETKDIVMNNEYRLPQLLKPLFIDEDFILQDEEIVFKDSVVLDGVRYYNLVAGFDNKAIDWGVVDDKYLIFTTSKETAEILVKEL